MLVIGVRFLYNSVRILPATDGRSQKVSIPDRVEQ